MPVVSREVIARTFRPAGTSSVNAALKTLRTNQQLTKGVAVAARSATGGRLAGRLTLYSSLNRDAALMARLGRAADAVRLAREAHEIESSAPFDRVRVALEEHLVSIDRPDVISQVLIAAVHEDDALKADVVVLTERAERFRARFPELAAAETVIHASVRAIAGALAELTVDGGETIALPAGPLRDWDVAVGEALTIRTASHGLGTGWWQVLRGIELDAGHAPRDPFLEPPKALTAEQELELADLLEGGPTVTAVAPVAIVR